MTAPANDPAAPIVKKIFATQEEFLSAISSNYFYLELMLVGIALTLAWLLAYAIRFRIKIYLQEHPIQKIDHEFITNPLAVLPSLLSFILLNVVKPLAVEYSKNSEITDAAIQLCVYYIVAKAILLIMRYRPMAWFLSIVIMVVAVLDVSGFLKITTTYLSSVSFNIGSLKLSALNVVNGMIILVVVLWGAGVLSKTLESYLRRSSALSYNARELTVKFFRIFVYFIALIIALSVFGVDLTAFAVFGGALGVGIGLGLQKVTANFVSGITLLLEKSIMIGDLVEVAGNVGHVREMNIRYALIETSDGRELLVPNEELTSSRVTNWTHSNENARIEVKAILNFEADAKKAIKIMLDAARNHPRCIKKPEPLCWLREFTDSGILFVLAFWIGDVHEGRNTPQSEVMLAILENFRREGIKFAQNSSVVSNLLLQKS